MCACPVSRDEALLATGQMPERPARWELALAFERKSFETAVSQVGPCS